MDKLDKYKNSLYQAWGFNDYNDWPIKFNSIMHLFIEEFSQEFRVDLLKAVDLFGVKKVAEAFGNPSRIYRIIHSIVCGMKRCGMDMAEQRKVALLMLDMVGYMKAGSPYNEDGRNIVEEIDCDIMLDAITDNEKRKVALTCSLLWAYTECIFFRAHDVTKEFHGLYDTAHGKVLVRDYLNLSPQSIWSDAPLLNFQTFRTVSTFRPAFDLKIDSYNHLYLESGNMIEDLIGCEIYIDGKRKSIQEGYDIVCSQAGDTIHHIKEWSLRASDKEKIKRYADIYWYRKKPLCDLLGIPWEVPPNVYQKIDEGKVDERLMGTLSAREIKFLINTLI